MSIGACQKVGVGVARHSTLMDRRLIDSKVLACVSTNRSSAEQNTNCDSKVEIGFGATTICRPHSYDGLFYYAQERKRPLDS